LRSIRWIPILLAATGAFLSVGNAAAAPRLTTQIAEQQVALWRCQDQLSQQRTPVSVDPWSLPHSQPYRRWVLNLWTQRRSACIHVLHQRIEVWRRLERGLSGSPMAGTGRDLEAAGRRHHVSPYFIAAIAATESSLGAAMCGHYNAWGLGNCTGIWNVPAFGSWAEAYDFMGRFLHERWPNARTPYDYHGYAACSSCWGSKTASHMARLFGVTASVSY